MRYVDGYVLPVPKRNLPVYRRLAQKAGKVWRENGAVVFSWIVFRSRTHRDRVNARVMKDPRMAKMMTMKPPFDPKRMVYGGFVVLVDA